MTRYISVIMACQDARKQFHQQAIGSVLSQKLPPGWEMELILQQDGNAPTLASLAQQDSRIVYGCNRNLLGPGLTRNNAASQALGELIAIIDDDDWWGRGYLERRIQDFDEHPHISYSLEHPYLFEEGRKPWTADIAGRLPEGEISPGLFLELLNARAGDPPAWMASLILRANVFHQIGGYPGPTPEDVWMISILSLFYWGFNRNDPRWFHRVHGDQMTRRADFAAGGKPVLELVNSVAEQVLANRDWYFNCMTLVESFESGALTSLKPPVTSIRELRKVLWPGGGLASGQGLSSIPGSSHLGL